jgi:peroxiredoxin
MEEFRRRRCAVVAVVVDPPETNVAFARQLGVGLPILSDPGAATSAAYGLRHAGGGPGGQDIAYSASVLIDAEGVVRWRSITDNARVRPLPETVLAAVDALPR